jgi:hypothetical protein
VQLRERWPAGAVRGGDCVTGRYEIRPGERIVDLDTDLEALPAWGLLCLHEATVASMVEMLGWRLHDPKLVTRIFKLRDQIKLLRDENRALRQALSVLLGEEDADGVTEEIAVIEDEELPV